MFGKQLNKDDILFSLAYSLISSSYKAFLCFIRRYLFKKRKFLGKKIDESQIDHIAAPIAGVMSGFFIILDPNRDRRVFIMTLLCSRLVDILINHYMQNAYESKYDEQRNINGKDKLSKHILLLILFSVSMFKTM